MVEADKSHCEGIHQVMEKNKISYKLECGFASEATFRAWTGTVDHIDLVDFDIQKAEATLIPSLLDVLSAKAYRLIIATHDPSIHEQMQALFRDWITIWDVPRQHNVPCVKKYLRGYYNDAHKEKDRFNWKQLLKEGCYHSTPRGLVAQTDGEIIVDNPKFVNALNAFSMRDDELRINDLSVNPMALPQPLPVSGAQQEPPKQAAPSSSEVIATFSIHGDVPLFLAPMLPGTLIANGSAPIHMVHHQGKPHGCIWMFVLDSEGRILLLQRAQSMRICPGSWGLLGEHQHAAEGPFELAAGALDEELGPELRASGAIAHSVNLTPTPLWYLKDYGDGRVDRQATTLWAVMLNLPAAKVPLRPDNEVANFRWVEGADALAKWAQRDPTAFCEESIQALLLEGLRHLQSFLTSLV
jgi:isopentenyldiphosphate isomerase